MDQTPSRPDGMIIQPLDVGQILGAAFDIYKRNWQTLMAIAAVVLVPITFVQYFLQHALRRATVLVSQSGTLQVVHSGTFWRASLGGLLFGLLSFFGYFVLTGAITRAVASEAAGLDADMGDSYQYGVARFGSILWVSVLSGLAVLAGFILLIVPGFIVMTRLVGAMPALVVEDRRGSSALSRSWDLVRGRSWPVFGTIVVVALLVGAVNGILAAPFVGNWFARAIAATVASVVTLPYSVLVGVLLYVDVRTRKEMLTTATLQHELASTA